mmetsp:Transcript_26387/g.67329  ORF Transcript_26387/g.67329 Transcript_26387/m.67329 type:complete len:239 (-) Transcript_26387:761-1477(-)
MLFEVKQGGERSDAAVRLPHISYIHELNLGLNVATFLSQLEGILAVSLFLVTAFLSQCNSQFVIRFFLGLLHSKHIRRCHKRLFFFFSNPPSPLLPFSTRGSTRGKTDPCRFATLFFLLQCTSILQISLFLLSPADVDHYRFRQRRQSFVLSHRNWRSPSTPLNSRCGLPFPFSFLSVQFLRKFFILLLLIEFLQARYYRRRQTVFFSFSSRRHTHRRLLHASSKRCSACCSCTPIDT